MMATNASWPKKCSIRLHTYLCILGVRRQVLLLIWFVRDCRLGAFFRAGGVSTGLASFWGWGLVVGVVVGGGDVHVSTKQTSGVWCDVW